MTNLEIVKECVDDCMKCQDVEKSFRLAIRLTNKNIRNEIIKLIAIHSDLSEQIVGNNDFHLGAIKVLENLLLKIK